MKVTFDHENQSVTLDDEATQVAFVSITRPYFSMSIPKERNALIDALKAGMEAQPGYERHARTFDVDAAVDALEFIASKKGIEYTEGVIDDLLAKIGQNKG